jgi:hypothetical protein
MRGRAYVLDAGMLVKYRSTKYHQSSIIAEML